METTISISIKEMRGEVVKLMAICTFHVVFIFQTGTSLEFHQELLLTQMEQ